MVRAVAPIFLISPYDMGVETLPPAN